MIHASTDSRDTANATANALNEQGVEASVEELATYRRIEAAAGRRVADDLERYVIVYTGSTL